MCKEAIMRQGTDRSNAIATGSVVTGVAGNSTGSDSAGGERQQLSLSALLPGSRFFAGQDIAFTSLASSFDSAQPGELVVYRIGRDCPAKLVAESLARGAAGILTEQVLPCPLPQCIVGDVDHALAVIRRQQLGRPDRKLLTVGVIGSAGKTTTTLLLASMLRGCGIRTAYQSDLGQSDGVVQSVSGELLPLGERLVEWIGDASDCGCQAAIIEVSDGAARQGQYDSIEFDVLVVTGSAVCSEDYGPSGLQSVLERLTPSGVVIAPADDPRAMRTIRDACVPMVTYGVCSAADVTAKIIDQSGGMTTLLVTHHDTTTVMETSLCGPAMAANHAAATLFGLLIAQPLALVVETLSQLRVVPGRGERLEHFGHATVVIDAGGTPDRVATTLRTYRASKAPGRLWCVLAANGHDAPQTLARYGTLLEQLADHSIVTAQLPTKATFLAASHGVLDGVQRCAAFRLVADFRRAIQWAVSAARPSDTILVITGQRGQSAREQRVDLEQISAWVEEARQSPAAPQLRIVG
jgi:UDP-N-acetylmuramoyl-L-alanyl-D-glutamate--2,6-diaminopimelate ligase